MGAAAIMIKTAIAGFTAFSLRVRAKRMSAAPPTVKMGDAASLGPTGRAVPIRVKGGATLDANGVTSGTYGSEKNMVLLEEGATFTTSVSQGDNKTTGFTTVSLSGDATVYTPAGVLAIAQHFNYDYTHVNLGAFTLTKTGMYDFFLSACMISGTGVFDVREGGIILSSSYYNTRHGSFADGTLRIANGAFLKMIDYTGANAGGGSLTVKNLELDGTVTRSSATYSTLTVTGYATGSGTTPMLTLGADAVIRPTNAGYLTVTESLNGTVRIDLSGVDFVAAHAVTLFKVGSAEMLPAAADLVFTGSGIPNGWDLVPTSDGLGYKLNGKSFNFILR